MVESSSPRVAIVDYGVGNLFSVAQACKHVGLDAEITGDSARIASADAIILPGVGAFQFAMHQLDELGITRAVKSAVDQGKPLMGICLGFQLLFERSSELGSTLGLGLIPGQVMALGPAVKATGFNGVVRSPNIAWLPVREPLRKSNQTSWEGTLMQNVPQHASMYFVHSFYAKPDNPDHVVAESSVYGMTYCSAVARNNVFGCQFHPEKSDKHGLLLYRNLAMRLAST